MKPADDVKNKSLKSSLTNVDFITNDQGTFIKLADSESLLSISNAKLTDEQILIIKSSLSGADIKVNAFAGTGKTTVIKAIASINAHLRPSTNIVYLAFNKFIAEDVKNGSKNSLKVYTIHQFARNSLISSDEKLDRKLKNPLISYTKTPPDLILKLSNNAGVDKSFLEICISTVDNFTKSIDDKVKPAHVPKGKTRAWLFNKISKEYPLIAEEKIHSEINSSTTDSMVFNLILSIVESSQALWLLIIDNKNEIQLSFDYFLKLWSLNSYHSKADLLMIDESQDLDPVMLCGISSMECQKIWVGDKDQQIYRWRGAINAMQNIECTSLYLTETFRFNSKIASYANAVLSELGNRKFITSNKLSATPSKSSHTAILCRTNLSVLLHCIQLSQKGKLVHVVSKVKESFLVMLETCHEMDALRNGTKRKTDYLSNFSNFDDLIDSIDDCSQEIKQAFRIFEHYGFNYSQVESAIKLCSIQSVDNQEDAEYIICTAHLSKGREWDFVILDEDFESFILNSDESTLVDELRLFYVAITRCKNGIINHAFVERILGHINSIRDIPLIEKCLA